MVIATSNNTKRIAKNTVVLYVRMIVVMLIALYTSRVVLQALGVEDFGLYNVIGGVAGLFAFLRTSMEKATQRFLNVEMVRPDGQPNRVFCVNVTIHLFIVLAIVVLTETIGLWFLNTYIDIPAGREVAANWVYQTVVVSLCATVLSVPYSSCIIAHEEMGFYAVVSIVDAMLKLIIAFLITFDQNDRLIYYGTLMMGISIVNILLYYIFCRKRFDETCFHLTFDRTMYKEVFGFISWTLVGQLAILGTNQGNNILVNMFHSVTANAAMSIGNQVNSAVTGLTSNFQTAFNPQITKSYTARDFCYLKYLVYSASKISYILLFVISLPLMFNIEWILKLWLETVPPYSGIFCRLFLWNGILNALSAPLNFCVMASGRIKKFQIMTALVYLSDLIILYFLFAQGLPPATAMYVKVGIMMAILFVRLHYTNKVAPIISLISYTKEVLCPLAISSILPLAISIPAFSLLNGILGIALATIITFATTLLSSFFIALSGTERNALLNMVKKIKHKI